MNARIRKSTMKRAAAGVVIVVIIIVAAIVVAGGVWYMQAGKSSAPASTTGTEQAKVEDITLYTCPMPEHAFVVTDEPGDCPECGMKLVPTSEVEHGAKAEEQWRTEHAK